jgi:hypothetical protein
MSEMPGVSDTGMDNQAVLSCVREDIASGKIKIIVGTVAYLGEGWDAPWINSLILATTIRSYVTSNQMRGRAIRYLSDDPEKTSAIWHIACMDPSFAGRFAADEQIKELSERFRGFMGLTLDGMNIENGIERLQIPAGKMSEQEVTSYNQSLLATAGSRNRIYRQWQEAFINKNDIYIEDRVFIHKNIIFKNFHYYNSLLAFSAGILSMVTVLMDRVIMPLLRHNQGTGLHWKVVIFLLFVGVSLSSKYGYEFLYKLSPQSRFSSISERLRNAMVKADLLSPNVNLEIKEEKENLEAGLGNATLKENTEYARVLTEFYGPIENPRYLITERSFLGKTEYYPVPTCFSTKKSDVELLLKALNVRGRNFKAHYLRNPNGRKLLLKARIKAYSNRQRELTKHKRMLAK